VSYPTSVALMYTRYVAIGDSQTEGLWDGDDAVGLTGFADRLAVILYSLHPGLVYANLAIRGERVSDVLRDQLPPALAMRPDLITVCAGMNDVTRPGRSFDQALTDLDVLYARLAESGATVVTTTFPNVERIVPIGRINAVINTAAERFGFGLVDLYHAPSMAETDTWSADLIHASTKGHILFAAAAAEALGLPAANHDWAHARGEWARPLLGHRVHAQVRWTNNLLLPWFWNHIRGRSTGDGRVARRPRLEPVTVRCD